MQFVVPLRHHIITRLHEAREVLKVHAQRAKLYSWTSTILTIGQYIVGAALASSFVQESVSRPAIGSLGLVVLLASAVQQRFRPDSAARSARRCVLQIGQVIRNAEDALVAQDSGQTDAPSPNDIIASLSNGITSLEIVELGDADLGGSGTKAQSTQSAKNQKSKKVNSAQKSIQP